MKVGINLYTVRDLDDPLPRLLERVADAGYDGVEFAGIDDAPIRETLDETGLAIAGAHVPIGKLEADLKATATRYRDLGCPRIVVPYLDEERFASIEATTETANRLDGLGERLAETGIAVHYHNHDHEFTDLGETSGFEAFVERSSVGLELDLGWIAATGRDPAVLLDRYENRVSLVHAKDTLAGDPVELGEGELDLENCIASAREAGVEWLIYEHDAPDDPVESLERGSETLSRFR